MLPCVLFRHLFLFYCSVHLSLYKRLHSLMFQSSYTNNFENCPLLPPYKKMQNPAEVKGSISSSSRSLCKEVKYRMGPSGSLSTKGLESQKCHVTNPLVRPCRTQNVWCSSTLEKAMAHSVQRVSQTALQQTPDTLP